MFQEIVYKKYNKERLTGLALTKVHSNETEEINTFTKKDKDNME